MTRDEIIEAEVLTGLAILIFLVGWVLLLGVIHTDRRERRNAYHVCKETK